MGGRRSWVRFVAGEHQTPVDVVVALGLLALALVVPFVTSEPGGWTIGALVLCVLLYALLPLARVRSLPVLVILTALFLVSQLRYDLPREFSLPLLYTAYATTSFAGGRRKTRLLSVAAVAVALDASALLTPRDSWSDSRYLMISSWVLLMAAVGDAVRNRRAYVREIEGRALRAEQSRELEASRRVTEERLRIARDVHDLVAHHMAVINVQAGVAGHLFDRDPVAAKQALGQVRCAASSVLQELGGLVGLLRQPDDKTTPSTEPSPTSADVPRLLESFAAAGLQVSWTQTGSAGGLPASIELTAFRLIQESLTNAHKYGDGAAEVVVAYEDCSLTIDVDNIATRGASSASHGGHGLVGMRERVGAAGGTVKAGRTQDGRFHVHARLPLNVAGTEHP
jgi:signal transduction histidine kinase